MEQKITEVVAALIWEGERFLICQRPAHKARGLLWEFVGGKVEPGEPQARALIRECRKELGIALAVGDAFMDAVHEYSDLTVHLTLFHATIADGIPQKLEHNDIRWITVDEISQYTFCPADEAILIKLKKVRKYNKLVRDRIPDIIEADGKTCVTEILDHANYLQMLDAKLTEELTEYQESKSLEELADLLEVLRAVLKARGWTWEQLEQVCDEKAAKCGSFQQKLMLKEVTEN